MLVQLFLLSSLLLFMCDSHAPLHRIYYGPHRYHPSLSTLPSSPSNMDISLFGNRYRNSEVNSEKHRNGLNSMPTCSQLKYLWSEANRLAVNIYGPEMAFTHPKLHANPFYLSSLLLRKQHLFGSSVASGSGESDTGSDSGSDSTSDKGLFVQPETVARLPSTIVNPSLADDSVNKVNNDVYSDFNGFGEIQDRLATLGELPLTRLDQQPSVPGSFSDYSIPKTDLGPIYGTLVYDPDQSNHHDPSSPSSPLTSFSSHLQSSSQPSSTSSTSSSSVSPSSSLQTPSSPSTSSTSPFSSSLRKDAKHSSPKLGFGAIISNNKDSFGSGHEEASHRTSESSKKVDNLFAGHWHDRPIDFSFE
ncbi:putative protein TPRXL isoform X2 [Tetranychus urticae]|nr:putative protein TPRXL isoform X2 [Tetranychus urticae]